MERLYERTSAVQRVCSADHSLSVVRPNHGGDRGMPGLQIRVIIELWNVRGGRSARQWDLRWRKTRGRLMTRRWVITLQWREDFVCGPGLHDEPNRSNHLRGAVRQDDKTRDLSLQDRQMIPRITPTHLQATADFLTWTSQGSHDDASVGI